jgi:hypothetical protein
MWKSVNYEVCGRSHIKSGIPCQDRTLSFNKNGVDIIVLADGAGSAKLSHFGAELVTKAAGEYISSNFNKLVDNPDGKEVKLSILSYLLEQLANASNELNCEINDLASTLLLVAASQNTFLMLHIGDGVIGYLKDNQLKVASMPENGEFANSTTFVTSKNALSSMRLFKGRLDGISGFVLMSDGTAESLYHKQSKRLASVIIRMMHRNCLISHEKMLSLLKSSFDQLIALNTQDDCSIALMSRKLGILCDYFSMTDIQKCEILGVSPKDRSLSKRLKRFDTMLFYLDQPKTLGYLSKILHIKPKYAKRHLKRLEKVGLISKSGQLYSRVF